MSGEPVEGGEIPGVGSDAEIYSADTMNYDLDSTLSPEDMYWQIIAIDQFLGEEGYTMAERPDGEVPEGKRAIGSWTEFDPDIPATQVLGLRTALHEALTSRIKTAQAEIEATPGLSLEPAFDFWKEPENAPEDTGLEKQQKYLDGIFDYDALLRAHEELGGRIEAYGLGDNDEIKKQLTDYKEQMHKRLAVLLPLYDAAEFLSKPINQAAYTTIFGERLPEDTAPVGEEELYNRITSMTGSQLKIAAEELDRQQKSASSDKKPPETDLGITMLEELIAARYLEAAEDAQRQELIFGNKFRFVEHEIDMPEPTFEERSVKAWEKLTEAERKIAKDSANELAIWYNRRNRDRHDDLRRDVTVDDFTVFEAVIKGKTERMIGYTGPADIIGNDNPVSWGDITGEMYRDFHSAHIYERSEYPGERGIYDFRDFQTEEILRALTPNIPPHHLDRSPSGDRREKYHLVGEKRRWFSGKGTPRLYYGAASSSIGRGPEVEKYNHSDEIVEGAIFRTVVPLMRGPEAGHESN